MPAESVGGDFYQLFRLSDDRIGIMIGDVSSHGFSAALIMALTISAAAIYAQQAGPPADVLRSVHEALQGELETTEMYLTLFYCVIDPNAGRIAYSNAGHPHVFRIRPEGTFERLGATDPPMGMLKLTTYNEATVDWHEGKDLLFLFTDGLSDAYDGEGTGEDNLVAEVAAHRNDTLEAILDRIFTRAEATATDIPADDRSAVLIRG